MQKAGESEGNIVMFLAVMFAVLIGLSWLLRHNYPFQDQLAKIDSELMRLQVEFGAACNSPLYESMVNPRVDYGILYIRGSEICISSSLCNRLGSSGHNCTYWQGILRCRQLVCDTGLSLDFNLKQITYVSLSKNVTFQVTAQ